MSHIHLHRQTPNERHPYMLALLYWDKASPFPRYKGMDPEWIASRPMTEEELAMHLTSPRLSVLDYKTWEALIIDEWEHTGSRSWCKMLHGLSGLSQTLDDLLDNPSPPPAQQDLFNDRPEPDNTYT